MYGKAISQGGTRRGVSSQQTLFQEYISKRLGTSVSGWGESVFGRHREMSGVGNEIKVIGNVGGTSFLAARGNRYVLIVCFVFVTCVAPRCAVLHLGVRLYCTWVCCRVLLLGGLSCVAPRCAV